MTWWRRLLASLPPEDFMTAPVVLGSFAWAALVHFGDAATNGVTHIPERMLALIGAQVAFFVIPVAVWLLVRRDPRPQRATAFLIGAVLLGCVARGYAFGWLLYLTGTAPQVEVFFRSLTSISNMTLAVGLLWFITAGVRRHAQRRQSLLAEQEVLHGLQTQAAVELAHLDDEAAEQVRVSVLEGLGHGEPARGEEVLRRLRTTLDDVVRPLSRQLEAQGEVWQVPMRPESDYRLRWWPTVKAAADPALIHPVIVPLMIVWIVILGVTARFGVAMGAAASCAALVVLVPLLWLGRRVGTPLTRRAPAAVKALVFAVVVVVSGVAFGMFDLPFAAWTTAHTPFTVAAPVYTVLFSLLLALADSALLQAQAVEDELSALTGEMRWALARAREEHRQHRLALAHAVHGPIQATLSAAVLQLDRALREGTADDAMVADIQHRVVGCVSSLDLRFTPPDDLPELLDKLQTTWAGVANVTLSLDEAVEQVLAQDPQCLRCVNDLLPELAFNAIKHGKARHVDLRLAMDSPSALELEVRDDGSADGGTGTAGLGTRLIEDCSLEWARSASAHGTVTTVVLPALPLTGRETLAI